jgi:hypothetical protein
MNHRHTTAAALAVVATLSVAACGTRTADDSEPTGRRPASSPDHAAAWQAYYDMTHPPPRVDLPSGPGAAFQVYYDMTHPPPRVDLPPGPAAAFQVYYDLTHPAPTS